MVLILEIMELIGENDSDTKKNSFVSKGGSGEQYMLSVEDKKNLKITFKNLEDRLLKESVNMQRMKLLNSYEVRKRKQMIFKHQSETLPPEQ